MRTPFLFLLLFLFILPACEEFTEWELDLENESRLVVEAILTNELRTQEIRLSQSHHALNEAPTPVTDAKVFVSANGIIFPFGTNANDPGLYLSAFPFTLIENLEYDLYVEWGGVIYTASSKLSTVAPLHDIFFRQHSDPDSVFLDQFFSSASFNQNSMYEVNIDWAHISGETPNRALQYFYIFEEIYIGKFVSPAKERVLFPKGSIVIAKKYGLNDDFAAFLRSQLIETSWNSPLFYLSPGNAPSNLSNDAIGFFTTCSVLSDTLVAE